MVLFELQEKAPIGERSMKIAIFYVAFVPTSTSVFEDLVWCGTLTGLRNLFLGGTSAKEIIGIYTEEKEASEAAREALLKMRAEATA